MHVKRVCKDFEIENLGEYLDLYLKTDTLLLADDFEYFRKTGLELSTSPRHSINRYANNKCVKDYDKSKELPYLKFWDVNNLYGWKISRKLPVIAFELVESISGFDESFIKSYK